jgi:hypothetical protein
MAAYACHVHCRPLRQASTELKLLSTTNKIKTHFKSWKEKMKRAEIVLPGTCYSSGVLSGMPVVGACSDPPSFE